MLSNFNLLCTTLRGNERQVCYELAYLIKEAGDTSPKVDKTGIRGVIVGKTSLDPFDAIGKFHDMLQERPYEFRYALRILPIEIVVQTDIEEVERGAAELARRLHANETFRITVEKRYTSIHSRDFIETAAKNIHNKVDLDNPDRILLIEVLRELTGISLVKPVDIISVLKEKML